MNIFPTDNYYLVIAESSEQEKALSKHNLVIPDHLKGDGNIGKVVQTHFKEHPLIRAGSTIVYKKYGNEEVSMDGVDYLIVPQENIVAVVSEKDPRAKE